MSSRSFLHIFEVKSLSVASFAIIFSHSKGCLSPLLIVSLVVQKVPFFFIFAFISYCDLCQSVLSMFSSRSFAVSGLMFRTLSRFEFILVYGVRLF